MKAKLTPAQERVVKAMRRGWALRLHSQTWSIVSPRSQRIILITTVAKNLVAKGVVAPGGQREEWVGTSTEYTLSPEWQEGEPS